MEVNPRNSMLFVKLNLSGFHIGLKAQLRVSLTPRVR